jgi:hypothetical protein
MVQEFRQTAALPEAFHVIAAEAEAMARAVVNLFEKIATELSNQKHDDGGLTSYPKYFFS